MTLDSLLATDIPKRETYDLWTHRRQSSAGSVRCCIWNNLIKINVHFALHVAWGQLLASLTTACHVSRPLSCRLYLRRSGLSSGENDKNPAPIQLISMIILRIPIIKGFGGARASHHPSN